MLDFKREVGSLFGLLDIVKNIVHLGTFLGALVSGPAAYNDTCAHKRDLFGNKQSVERSLKLFLFSWAVFFHL